MTAPAPLPGEVPENYAARLDAAGLREIEARKALRAHGLSIAQAADLCAAQPNLRRREVAALVAMRPHWPEGAAARKVAGNLGIPLADAKAWVADVTSGVEQ